MILSFSNVSLAAEIFSSREEETLTKGVTYESRESFSEDGWVKTDILKVDLTEPNVKLKVMTSPDGSSRLSTVKTMAEKTGAKAAVNADFFNFPASSGADTNMLGMVFEDGEIISTPAKDNLASFAITEDNEVIFDYFTFSGQLIAENTSLCEYSTCDLYQINKLPVTGGAVTMITSAWGSDVFVPVDCYALIAEGDFENGYKMTNLSWGGEEVAVPSPGAVFIANYTVNGFLNENFAVGDTVRVEYSVTPDVGAIKEASGGNSVILKDGEIFPFTSEVKGYAQRTALGVDRDYSTLYIVTCDGREGDCPGFTQTQMAQFMLSLGCDDAINLDGGGSTTMVAQNRFTSGLDVKNDVSSLRSVATALGVFSEGAASGEAFGAEVSLSTDRIVLGDSVDVYSVFYDENFNNIYVDPNDITYSCSDPFATIEGNRITPSFDGVYTVTAEHGGVFASARVTVIKDIFSINIYPETVSTDSGDAVFTVTAYDKNGFSAQMPPELLSFSSEGNVTLDGNRALKGSGKGTVTASYGLLKSTAVVNGEKYERRLDERGIDTFEGYIDGAQSVTVSGKIAPSSTLFGRFLANTALSELSLQGDVYMLASFEDPYMLLPNHRDVAAFTERTVENSKIVTFSNSKSTSFRLTEKSAWEKLKHVSENAPEKNIVIMINEPLYRVNDGEQKVFKSLLNTMREKGKNVFVISTGEKSEVTTEDGVRYIYLGTVGNSTLSSYFYDTSVTGFLTMTFSGDDIKYCFS